MKRLLLGLLLLTPVVATAQPIPTVGTSRNFAGADSVATEAASQVSPAWAQLTLEGKGGFRSLYYLLNRGAWPTLPRDGAPPRSGSAAVDLADPLQTIVIFNAWHLPTAHGPEDIRLADLRKYVLRSTVVFVPDWPAYTTPGFIVLVQKRTHEWALVARLASVYLVEDQAGIGVCSVSTP